MMSPQPTADEEQEEVQPELMASIMHTEEIGVTLGTKPVQMYNFLFPEERTEEVINVSNVAPNPLEDAVVPLMVASQLQVQGVTHEVTVAAEEITKEYETPPADDIYTEQVVKREGPRVQNVAHIQKKKSKEDRKKEEKKKEEKKKDTSLDSEQPPWIIDPSMLY